MTAADDTFAAMDADLFEAFGQPASVQRGAESGVDVVVIVDRGVTRFGEYGQSTGTVDMLSFRNSEFAPRVGDVVTIATVARAIDSVASDDGSVTRVVLRG